ncbi:Protein of unknown function [Gryllus bimaculatus]|nr:Protein of unknown function [Gryllus bimaculatus]
MLLDAKAPPSDPSNRTVNAEMTRCAECVRLAWKLNDVTAASTTHLGHATEESSGRGQRWRQGRRAKLRLGSLTDTNTCLLKELSTHERKLMYSEYVND